ncbi:rhamnulokinase [bacterium]|nr:rhamnulokinase [bacterium]
MNILAFDLGASSGRALIGRFDGARLSIEEAHRFPNQMIRMRGHFYWDVQRLFAEMQTGLQKAVNTARITAMGIDTWGVDGCFVGRGDTFLGFPYAYRDFSLKNMKACSKKLGAEFIYERTGIQFMPFNTLFQFFQHKRSRAPQLKAADAFLFIPEFFRYLFTGERATEYTIASTSQMVNARTRTWDEEIIAKLRVPRGLFGDIIEPGTVCGAVEGTDIKAIAVAGHDTGSAVVSVPAVQSGDDWAWLSSGTWSIIGIETKTPITTPEAFATNYSNEGGVFGTVRFLRNVAGLWLCQECARIWKARGQEYSYAELDRMAREAAPGGPLINVNDPRFNAPDDMPAEIQAACREGSQPVPHSPGEIQRCILESLARAYKATLDDLTTASGKRFSKLHMVGGGIQNRLLNQMTADACGITVEAGPVEGTAIGNIVMQLVALGELRDLQQAREVIRASFPTEVYEPEAV